MYSSRSDCNGWNGESCHGDTKRRVFATKSQYDKDVDLNYAESHIVTMSDDKSEKKPFAKVDQDSVYNMMRRLQEQVRSNIPALIAQRALTSFTLHQDEAPPQAREQVLVVVYPQDPFIGEPEVRRMTVNDIRSGLTNGRVQIEDHRGETAQPDVDGNYMYWPGTIEFDQVNAFYYTTFTLRMYERYARRSLPWSFPSARIKVNPYAGQEANAFYDEQNQMIGFHTFVYEDRELSTAQSADIVSHEAAHAILDGVRDLYNESFGLGTRSFHESFSDITAVLVALHDDSLIRRLLKWTDGNLRMSNFVSQVAERLVELTQHGGQYMSAHTLYLRNAFNQFVFKPFDELPFIPQSELELCRQEHSYSRLFSGAFYDIFVGMYENLLKTVTSYIAIYKARDMSGQLLMAAIEAGPVGELDFSDLARTFLSADEVLNDGANHEVIKQVFHERGILSMTDSDAYLDSLKNLPDLRLPSSINSWLASVEFLENDIVPALNLDESHGLVPLATYRNSDGNAFVTYFSSRSVRLQGEQYGKFAGTKVDVFGGLTLMFDAKDRLRSVCYRPVIEEDERQIRILIAEMIQAGAIVDQLYISNHEQLQNRMPQGLYVLDALPGKLRDDGFRLVKYPVIFDEVPVNPPGFEEYLNIWGAND